MGKKSQHSVSNQSNRQKFFKKKHSAVTFDENERDAYLKGMFGAKKRRRDHYIKKVEEETRVEKKLEKAEIRNNRRE